MSFLHRHEHLRDHAEALAGAIRTSGRLTMKTITTILLLALTCGQAWAIDYHPYSVREFIFRNSTTYIKDMTCRGKLIKGDEGVLGVGKCEIADRFPEYARI